MRYTPREIKENVNISKVHPLKECFTLLAGILGVMFAVYIILGFVLDIIVTRMPDKVEAKLSGFFNSKYKTSDPSPAEEELQLLLDGLVDRLPDRELDLTVRIIESETANALAFPGGNIVIFSKLIEQVESENELTMVLAHEVGHYVHRDHLRGLGRGLVLTFLTTALFGSDHNVAQFMMNTLMTAHLKHSRDQERAADMFALKLLYKKYGHAAGATGFFEEMKKKEGLYRYIKYFLTHPISEDRIKKIEREIKRNKYPVEAEIPLREIFLDYKETE